MQYFIIQLFEMYVLYLGLIKFHNLDILLVISHDYWFLSIVFILGICI